MNKITDSH